MDLSAHLLHYKPLIYRPEQLFHYSVLTTILVYVNCFRDDTIPILQDRSACVCYDGYTVLLFLQRLSQEIADHDKVVEIMEAQSVQCKGKGKMESAQRLDDQLSLIKVV